MPKIFISYRRRDAPAHVAKLKELLEKKYGAASVFVDHEDIVPGEDFHAAIAKSLKECDICLVVIGRKWLALMKQRRSSAGAPRERRTTCWRSSRHPGSTPPGSSRCSWTAPVCRVRAR